jgi:hypothetical protein
MNTKRVYEKSNPAQRELGKLLRVNSRDHFQNEELQPHSLA